MLITAVSPEIFVGLRGHRKEHALKLLLEISNIPLTTIIERVAKIQNITPDKITGRGATGQQRYARSLVCYFACKGGRYKLREIGEALGGRHHSTVLNAKEAVSDPMSVNKSFAERINEIEKMVCTGSL